MQEKRETVRRRIGGAALLMSALTTTSASAGISIVETDTEINDSFLTRQILAPGSTGVSGNLDPATPFDPGDYDYVFKSSLAPGVARSFIPAVSGLEGRIGFFAWTDNTVGDGPSPDTIMRSLDHNLNQNMFADNTTLVGNGFASLFAHHTNSDGTINLEVSGVGDHTFTGNHTETGDFNLYIKVRPVGDLDVYSFVDLVPGSAFDAEITTAAFDTVLGWLDDNGNIVTIDNNGGSPITGTIGRVTTNFAFLDPVVASAGNDLGFTLERNSVPFASLAETRNQASTAAALDRSGDGALYRAPARAAFRSA